MNTTTLPPHDKRGTGTQPPADMADAIAQAVYLPPSEGLAKDAPPRAALNGKDFSPTPNPPECQTARAALDLIEGLTATMIPPAEAARWRALAAELEARLSEPAQTLSHETLEGKRKLILATLGPIIIPVAAWLSLSPEAVAGMAAVLVAGIAGFAHVDAQKAKAAK